MATHALTMGAPFRAPSLPASSRRSFLGALAFAPVAAAPIITAASATIAAPHIDRTAWDCALAAMLAAKAAADRHEREFWTPAYEHLKRLAPRPDRSFTVVIGGIPHCYFVAHDEPANLLNHPLREVRERAKEIANGLKRNKALSDRLGLDQIGQRCDDLSSVFVDAEAALILTPAPDLAALHFKLDLLFGPAARGEVNTCDAWCAESINAMMADANRLLIKGA